MSYRHLINVDRFSIECSGPELEDRIQEARKALAVDGCAVLRDFLTTAGIEALTAETDAVAQFAHTSFNRTNPYFTQDDPQLDPKHPKRRFFDRSNAFVPADNFSKPGRCARYMMRRDSTVSFRTAFRKSGSIGTPTHWQT